VLPLVGSTIVPPGRSSPLASAASIIRAAIRSFAEPPGFMYSTLASTVADSPAVTAPRRTSGVPPIRSEMCCAYFTVLLSFCATWTLRDARRPRHPA
jgi:hypothetical protein